eukprot:TRINITY_DN3059_c0_g1_i1.p1 TRINITY_DN3059_c0_g1~~TRINITY_DN3059_c0_g1_i1.p1  ORF type:complete len:397 (-),score=63.18 TRINITY_DN3059_c0_g1_i1:72-1205(-)
MHVRALVLALFSSASSQEFLTPGSRLNNASEVSVLDNVSEDCSSVYGSGGQCANSCGSCKNAGARKGVRCNGAGSQTGYYCPPDPPANYDGQEVVSTFACMDWTQGSSAMQMAESNFLNRSGEDVYLGVGTYGISDDPQRGLGACYRLQVDGVDKDIIAQSINTGHDVAGNQFDLQIGAGGAGAFNTCAGGSGSMFPGHVAQWGCIYGGVDSIEECRNLPEYPRDAEKMQEAGDSLIQLCEYGWQKKMRLSGANKSAGRCKYNPTLLDVSRVKCPEELVHMTQIQRNDDPDGYEASNQHRPEGFPNLDKMHECNAQTPGMGVDYCLTRMMDCRKPSGAFVDNTRPELMVEGRRVVQTCTADGYTRIDVQCGCAGCYC